MSTRLIVALVAALVLAASATAAGHRLPAGVARVDVHSSRGASRHVTDPAKVAKIVRWFDALRKAPNVIYYCPMIRYGPPTTFYFRGASGALLAHARTPGSAACGGSFNFSVGGHAQKPVLVERFLVRVGHLLGLRLDPMRRF